ncbi:MAG: DHHA1 domain-containing protein, partial [Candidatus Aenigmatarchaeota archaeon]
KSLFFKALSKIDNYENIYFFDFSIRQEILKVSATLFKKVVWIDHHVNNNILNFQNSEIIIDSSSESAAKLVAQYFNFYSDWINVVNEVDTNNCKTETSKIIRDYFSYLRIKYGKLYNRILSIKVSKILDVNPSDFINSEEIKSYILEFENLKGNFIQTVENSLEIKQVKNIKIAVIEIKENIPPYIIYEHVNSKYDADMLLIIYRGLKGTKLELRSFKDVDVQKIASFFNGGGHKKASGAYLKESLTKSQILQKIEEIL